MKIIRYKKISSTSELAKELKLEAWTVILADEQTSGYGRKGREWFSPKGGLYFTIVLPRIGIDDLQILTFLAAFSIGKIIKEKFNLEPFIKLPNDIYINQKKICGILTENVIGKNVKLSIMGIGLNTNIEEFPRDLNDVATSLKVETGKKVNHNEILKKIITEIKQNLRTITQ